MVSVGISVSLYNSFKDKGMLCSYLFIMDCGLLGQQSVRLTGYFLGERQQPAPNNLGTELESFL